MKAFKKEVDKTTKSLEKAQSEVGKDSNTAEASVVVKLLSNAYTVTKEHMGICQRAYTLTLAAMKEQNRQAKSICVSLLGYKAKNESTSVQTESSAFNFSMI